ncbi:ubiquitin related modifier 1 [Aulographum hederae CBS 113979]|uniref:Ubiquitin-related modifier 1 n=1 Tax=Aulographum hederae CBS 113979 TaxID=1176131 RepID=A0A6G1GL04_9PEZI|nr:ubiquitin related modifier 1 [Aulographum hederae CBS 113979]
MAAEVDPAEVQTEQEEDVEVIPLTVEFSGGLEMLFADKKVHAIGLPAKTPDGKASNIAFLVDQVCEHLMEDDRKELFIQDDSVRPGILVLINDADWELEGEEKYEVKKGDKIMFVSTLHGG